MKKIIDWVKKIYFKHQVLILSTIIIILIISGILVNNINHNHNNNDNNQEEKNIVLQKQFLVKVSGEVNKERQISLNKATYLFEIIQMCDGFTAYADIDNINLIEKIDKDKEIKINSKSFNNDNNINIIDLSNSYDICYMYLGRINNQINIYKIDKNTEIDKIKWMLNIENLNISNFEIIDDFSFIRSNQNLININSATISELTQLNNIGSSTAQKIVEYRENNGPFTCIEDIMKVSGIKENIFNAIKSLICVG